METAATRPGYGQSGQPIKVLTNYYGLTLGEQTFYQYHIDIEPEIHSRKLSSGILGKVENLKHFGGSFVFEGFQLFSQQLFPDLAEEVSYNNIVYNVGIKFTNELSTASLTAGAAQLFNIIFRRVYRHLHLIPMGMNRRYFDPSKAIKIDAHRLEVWPGYSTSVETIEYGIALNIDVASKVLRQDNVRDILKGLMNDRRAPGKNLQEKANLLLVGQIVVTRYNNMTYKISSVDFTRTPQFKFDSKGQMISIAEHMKRKHNVDVTDPQQPLLVCETKKTPKEILLVPECCCMTGLTDDMVKDFRLMKDIGQYTRVGPEERVKSFEAFHDGVNQSEAKKTMDEWSIKMTDKLLEVNGRVLPPETIYLKQKKDRASSKADWAHILRNDSILKPVPLLAGKWLLVHTKQDEQVTRSFYDAFLRVSKPMGIDIGMPVIRIVDNDRAAAYQQVFEENLRPDFQLVVFIVPNNDKRRYDELKTFLTTKMPLPSQCIVGKTIAKEKMLMSVATKITLQIQSKIGGDLWRVDVPLNKTMIIGIDVYHDSARKGESVLAFCSTWNATFTQYYTQCIWHKPGQEISSQLMACMKQSIAAYYKQNQGVLPERIIVYRDGVGQGQLDAVINFEIPQMRQAFGDSYNPRLAVIVVQKRISTRFFHPQTHANMPPGLVVDRGIVSQSLYDFFVLSQSVTQGTASPTRYVVLADNTGLQPDHMQSLTYKLTHLYNNWNGTVGVPGPCQYAHKLAFLVGQSIHKPPNPDRLGTKLHFL
eukprot:c8759_g1_i2.p1 GENE.c8759_g1_i2~~c8759_g1_i2.p1  ORF type:complete len:770 (+),score=206.00 c8759_g1_i2:29-2311(+)